MEKVLLKFANWLEERGSHRHIDMKGEPYLDRYYLLKIGRLSIYLHRFYQSDKDGIHCHPWNNLSIVLTGGYWDRHHDGKKTWRPPFSVVFRTARELHRIEVPAKNRGKVWTLFFTGKRFRKWGFLESKSWSFKQVKHTPVLKGILFPVVHEDTPNPRNQ